MGDRIPRTGAPAVGRTVVRNWTCRLCSHSNPDSEDLCCQRCGAIRK